MAQIGAIGMRSAKPRRVRHRPPHGGRLERQSLHRGDRDQPSRAAIRAEEREVVLPNPVYWSGSKRSVPCDDRVSLRQYRRGVTRWHLLGAPSGSIIPGPHAADVLPGRAADPAEKLPELPSSRPDRTVFAVDVRQRAPMGEKHEDEGSNAADAALVRRSEQGEFSNNPSLDEGRNRYDRKMG